MRSTFLAESEHSLGVWCFAGLHRVNRSQCSSIFWINITALDWFLKENKNLLIFAFQQGIKSQTSTLAPDLCCISLCANNNTQIPVVKKHSKCCINNSFNWSETLLAIRYFSPAMFPRWPVLSLSEETPCFMYVQFVSHLENNKTQHCRLTTDISKRCCTWGICNVIKKYLDLHGVQHCHFDHEKHSHSHTQFTMLVD